MIFSEGFLKKYSTLRLQKPSIYNLEELYYKVLPITLKSDGALFLGQTDLTDEAKVTVNFPEFLDPTKNLSFIKSIHFAIDLSINTLKELEDNGSDVVRLVHPKDKLKSLFPSATPSYADDKEILPLPPDLYRLYLGYRHVPVRDVPKHIEGVEAVASKILAQMEDDCFTWIEVDPNSGIKDKTNKTSVLKFKVVIDLDVLRAWLADQFPMDEREALFKALDNSKDINLNLILHPPFMGRMSFKTSIEILYPQRTTRVKMLDRITFKSNRSFLANSKLYIIELVDKETDQILFKFNTQEDAELFVPMKKKINNKEVNSFFDKDLTTIEDSITVDFFVPPTVQTALSLHRNYKIRIRARDLTTQEKGRI